MGQSARPILTCTWAPTALAGPNLSGVPRPSSGRTLASGEALQQRLLAPVRRAEAAGVDYLLVAQRWWGNAEEIEGSTYDCLAMTAFYAAHTSRIRLVTAVHPGFFLPAVVAKWGATLDRLTAGRWAVNVTSGWHLQEFPMFGAEAPAHDERYARSREFIDVLRGAWPGEPFDYAGRFYSVEGLRLDPPPLSPRLEVFQGGQSEAAREMAATHSDWMFLNGGPPQKVGAIIADVRARAARHGRDIRFALYCIPLVRETDAEAWAAIEAMVAAVRPEMVERRRARVGGAEGMWAKSDDALTMLDSNEGFASRLIGSPDTVYRRMMEFHDLGVDMFHIVLTDEFVRDVLPRIQPR